VGCKIGKNGWVHVFDCAKGFFSIGCLGGVGKCV